MRTTVKVGWIAQPESGNKSHRTIGRFPLLRERVRVRGKNDSQNRIIHAFKPVPQSNGEYRPPDAPLPCPLPKGEGAVRTTVKVGWIAQPEPGDKSHRTIRRFPLLRERVRVRGKNDSQSRIIHAFKPVPQSNGEYRPPDSPLPKGEGAVPTTVKVEWIAQPEPGDKSLRTIRRFPLLREREQYIPRLKLGGSLSLSRVINPIALSGGSLS